jgi:hemoglobin-like flavoprotein
MTAGPTGPAGDPMRPIRPGELPWFGPETIAVVRASCRRLPENALVLTEEFYACLFEMAPGTRAMFAEDMTAQSERLLRALLAAVNALEDPQALEPQLRAWGAWHRHVHGVTNDMYVYVGHALVRAVVRVLGPTETSVGSAWIAVYQWLASVMIAGAEEESVQRPGYPTERRAYPG